MAISIINGPQEASRIGWILWRNGDTQGWKMASKKLFFKVFKTKNTQKSKI